MVICRTCNIPMQPVMSFSKDKHEKFDRCPKCFGETKHRKINEKFCKCPKCFSESKHQKLDDNELTFGEVLHKELHKHK